MRANALARSKLSLTKRIHRQLDQISLLLYDIEAQKHSHDVEPVVKVHNTERKRHASFIGYHKRVIALHVKPESVRKRRLDSSAEQSNFQTLDLDKHITLLAQDKLRL